MKNPLRKRFLRELKDEAGKYIVVFILLLASIGFVSGFLVADGSMRIAYNESFEKYNVEDGYFDTEKKITEKQRSAIEESGVTVYDNYYAEQDIDHGSTLRIYADREEVDRVCLMSGTMPKEADEIALDRMYATNNHIEIGDVLKAGEKSWKVTGYVALSDYSALFSNNNDTMFDAVKFGVSVVTPEGFESFSGKQLTYRYAWKYNQEPIGEQAQNKVAEDLMKDMGKVVHLENFVPRYLNQAITFTGNDMGSDRSMMIALLYMIIVILAFVFAITISNTVSKEANTIGTLRASGYTRGELVRHYISLPLIVTLIGALIGNILGYTIFEKVASNLYYGSYSLTTYHMIWNGEAFVLTTVVPFIVMLVINLIILSYKMSLSPLQFLRRDLRRRKQTYAIYLSKMIPFLSRFRLRIVFQNISNYIMLLIGIIFANLLLLFGLGLPMVLDNYQSEIERNMLSNYQYMLSVPVSVQSDESAIRRILSMLEYSKAVETDNETAEKFTAYSLNTTHGPCDSEEILLYGIQKDSQYIDLDVGGEIGSGGGDKGGGGDSAVPEVYISDGYADKYLLEPGDTITLKEKYKEDKYTFQVKGIFDYSGALSIFMSQDQLNDTLDLDKDYFSGYFSHTKITDISDKYIGSVIDIDALTKVSRQLDVSMGQIMYLVDGFAVMIFIVLIYLLSKIVIEKNAQSISMAKILGYKNSEISSLYIMATSIMVIISLLISMVIDYQLMLWIFRQIMLESMSGWIQFNVDDTLFVKMFVIGALTYGIVAILEFRKIQKVPMDEALKNVE